MGERGVRERVEQVRQQRVLLRRQEQEPDNVHDRKDQPPGTGRLLGLETAKDVVGLQKRVEENEVNSQIGMLTRA